MTVRRIQKVPEFEAAYAAFSGNAQGSIEEIRQFQTNKCEGRFGSFWSESSRLMNLRSISKTGSDVVSACLTQKSFRVTKIVLQGDALIGTFVNGGQTSASVTSARVVPEGIASCTSGGKQIEELIAASIAPNHSIAVECTRTEEKFEGQSGIRRVFRGGFISLATTIGDAQIPLIGFSDPPIDETLAEALERQLKTVQGELDATKNLSIV